MPKNGLFYQNEIDREEKKWKKWAVLSQHDLEGKFACLRIYRLLEFANLVSSTFTLKAPSSNL